ncbi:GDCCVxC domain-containing (seleno)protein [Phenylobacterium sp.]|uniref:GDCCVxC domain-containing (seleno)protein n=1 Tax=Phenylobacterium sp. TaxID=1871053 RepID=UPI003418B242
MQTRSTLTCPHCGHRATETMPSDACQYFYDCRGCGAVLRPKPGDCCVFCSYGDMPCPPTQTVSRARRRCPSCHPATDRTHAQPTSSEIR